MELVSLPLVFLVIVKFVLVGMAGLTLLAILCIILGVIKMCFHIEDDLIPCTKEAKEWKKKVEDKKGKK